MTLVLLFSACQKSEDTSDKFIQAQNTIHGLEFTDEMFRKLCSISPSKTGIELINLINSKRDGFGEYIGSNLGWPYTGYSSVNQSLADINRAMGITNFQLNRYEPVRPNEQFTMKDHRPEPGDVFVFTYAKTGNTTEWKIPPAVDIITGKISDRVNDLVGAAETLSDIMQVITPENRANPEDFANWGITSLGMEVYVIVGDVRMVNGDWYASVTRIDATMDKDDKLSDLKQVMFAIPNNPFSKFGFVQDSHKFGGGAEINILNTEAKTGLFEGQWKIYRNPVMKWVKDSQICELCTKHDYCSTKWQQCMNDPTRKNFNLVKNVISQCDDRCENPDFSCFEKKACLQQFGSDALAADRLVCPEKDDPMTFCEKNPQFCPDAINPDKDTQPAPGQGGGNAAGPMPVPTTPDGFGNFGGNNSTGCGTTCKPNTVGYTGDYDASKDIIASGTETCTFNCMGFTFTWIQPIQ